RACLVSSQLTEVQGPRPLSGPAGHCMSSSNMCGQGPDRFAGTSILMSNRPVPERGDIQENLYPSARDLAGKAWRAAMNRSLPQRPLHDGSVLPGLNAYELR